MDFFTLYVENLCPGSGGLFDHVYHSLLKKKVVFLFFRRKQVEYNSLPILIQAELQ